MRRSRTQNLNLGAAQKAPPQADIRRLGIVKQDLFDRNKPEQHWLGFSGSTQAGQFEGDRPQVAELKNLIGSIAIALIAALAMSPVAAETTAENLATESGAPDFFRPPPNMFQMTLGNRTAPGSNDTHTTTDTLNLRYDHAFDLPSSWILATRTDLPLLAKNPVSSDNPSGDYLKGVGDADIQAALIHDVSQRLAFGFGMRLIAPTGDDVLGSGKWQLMPIVGARYALPELSASSYFEPLLRYDASVAGDPTKKNISNLQFAPTFNIGLPDGWSLTLYPSTDIRINYGDPVVGQTGRWFVPFDFRATKKLSSEIAMSLEVGVPIVKDYPVYDLKTQLRLNVTW